MARIFEAKDKSGRIIYLTDERWKHILKHPEMSNQLEQIKDTLLHPDKVVKIEHDPDVRFYYKYYKERKEYLFISVSCQINVTH